MSKTTMTPERAAFEEWYATHAFDFGRDPIGSRECGLQWAAWQAAFTHLAERDAQPKISRRTGWMLESTEGKGWWDGRARWDFTTDPNAAVVFPTRSAADFQRLASFRGDVTVTEHVWMGTQTAQPAAEQAVDVEAMARDAERWRHCVSIKRFPAVCQDGENWVAWKTASPISSTHGNSPNSAIDAAMGTDTQNT